MWFRPAHLVPVESRVAVLRDFLRDGSSRPTSLLSSLILVVLAALTHALSAGMAASTLLNFEADLDLVALTLWGAHAPVLMVVGVLVPMSAQIVGSSWATLRSTLGSWANSGLTLSPASLDLTPALDRDLDFFSSTDFEDLLVFSLDALELLWQDVNLLVELCGENALGLGFLGLAWVSKRVFSARRLKR